jgi:multiple sugar transport system permease protein
MIKAIRQKNLTYGQFVVFATLLFALSFFGVPLLWLFGAAFRSEASLYSSSAFDWPDFDTFSTTWKNLTTYNNFQLWIWAKNSLIYSAGGVVLSLIACIPAGYALAIADFPGRKIILVTTLIAMITPSTALVLPIFLELNLLGLDNSYTGLVLASGFFPFGVYLAYIFFSTSLPKGVLDSARIDGCSRIQQFTRIALPLAKPIISLIAFFSFLAIWSNYFLAFVLLSDDKLYNLPVGLTALVSSSGALSNLPGNDIPIRKPEVLLASVLIILPVLLVFLVAQRFIKSGMLAGAEKG